MHLSFLASVGFLHPVGMSDYKLSMAPVSAGTCSARRQRRRHDANTRRKEGVPEVGGDRSTCNGWLTRVNSVLKGDEDPEPPRSWLLMSRVAGPKLSCC